MGKLLFKLARCKALGTLVGFIITFFPFLIPIKKIAQTKKLVSFNHPSPSYPNHVLIIPRKIARNIFCLSSDDFFEIVIMAIKIRSDYREFVLLINGGDRQDVMQAHFHLFTGNMVNQRGLLKENGMPFVLSDTTFWVDVVSNLYDLIKQNGFSDKQFSLLIQFDHNSEPTVYFI